MTTYTIGAVADRSGFSASALRYYETIGLVEPVDRTPAGYRLYDDGALERLSFIARAKHLGCSLDEIAELMALWERDECSPVQRRLHVLVTQRIDSARDQMLSLAKLTHELQRAAGKLAVPPIDGLCDDGCACSSAQATPHAPHTSTAAVSTAAPADIGCTLAPPELAGRLGEWAALVGQARERDCTGGEVRIRFDRDVPLDELARLVDAEQRCCSFLSFTLSVGVDGLALGVTAPAGAEHVVEALLGVPLDGARPRDDQAVAQARAFDPDGT